MKFSLETIRINLLKLLIIITSLLCLFLLTKSLILHFYELYIEGRNIIDNKTYNYDIFLSLIKKVLKPTTFFRTLMNTILISFTAVPLLKKIYKYIFLITQHVIIILPFFFLIWSLINIFSIFSATLNIANNFLVNLFSIISKNPVEIKEIMIGFTFSFILTLLWPKSFDSLSNITKMSLFRTLFMMILYFPFKIIDSLNDKLASTGGELIYESVKHFFQFIPENIGGYINDLIEIKELVSEEE